MKKSGPGSRFVEVPPDAIRDFLVEKGLVEGCVRNEVVFDMKNHNCRHITLRVYTTIACAQDETRDLGEDAIRVVAFYERDVEGSLIRKPVFKAAKILRTGSAEKVLSRIEERLREGYAVCNRFAKEQQCKHEDCVKSRIDHALRRAAQSKEASK